ncbi:MAG: YkgJ family cysteine cluster protein [Gammaproteobacteria bacterium]|nr:YkgJ family cysteine cluster protein [Gammaproteobacteria bacterium]
MQRRGRKAWWHDGVRFACQGSGKCCVNYGSNGRVYVTRADRRLLATEFGIPTREFTRRYCRKEHGEFSLDDPGLECRFLDGRRCSVYAARPTQCRTWPFWPENMRSRDWERVAEFCPGVGQGDVVPGETVAEILIEQRRATDKG